MYAGPQALFTRSQLYQLLTVDVKKLVLLQLRRARLFTVELQNFSLLAPE